MKRDLLPGFDGTTAFNGALRFHAATPAWVAAYGNMAPQGATFLAEDAFGVQYLRDDRSGNICVFWPETAKYEDLGYDEAQFWQIVKAHPNDTILLDLYDTARATLGPVIVGQHYAWIIELALGGEQELSNLEVMDAHQHMRALASIAGQIKDLPDGTPFRIEV
jgi:hypothetical protein